MFVNPPDSPLQDAGAGGLPLSVAQGCVCGKCTGRLLPPHADFDAQLAARREPAQQVREVGLEVAGAGVGSARRETAG